MPSVKSCFNATLFRKNLTRFWPIWGLYLFILVLGIPLRFLNQGFSELESLQFLRSGISWALVFGGFSAMAVFSYLYNNRSVQLMHSLPITRDGLFVTNYLSGLLFLLGPNVIVFFLSVMAGGQGFHYSLVLWLAAQSLICFFFYSFAVYCAMFTGNILALPVFYGILNGLASALAAVLEELMRHFLFGFYGTNALDELILWLTPVARMYADLSTELRGEHYILHGMSAFLLYGLVAIPLTIAALLLYRRRRLETAGDLVAVPWVRPIFKYGVAFCVSVSLGSYLYYTFRSLYPPYRWSILIPLILAGLLGYYVAEMLLKKRFKVFSGGWKGALVFSLLLVAAFVVTDNDLIGFNRTPSNGSVSSITISNISSVPNDTGSYPNLILTQPDEIDQVLSLHRNIISNRAKIQAEEIANADNYRYAYDEMWEQQVLPGGGMVDVALYTYYNIRIEYTLTDGRTLRRNYYLPLYQDQLSQSDSMESQITALINRPALVDQAYWQDVPNDARLVDVALTINPNTKGNDNYHLPLEDDAAQDALLAAVKADMAAGRIGTRYIFDSVERYTNCYYNDIIFTFYRSSESDDNKNTRRDWEISVTLQTTATETLKVLRSLGYTDGDELITWADYYQQESGVKYSTDAVIATEKAG